MIDGCGGWSGDYWYDDVDVDAVVVTVAVAVAAGEFAAGDDVGVRSR